ncbi:penicillin-binding protein activator [Ferrimonas sediminicola]|uniref:Penicillin-binding protein activator n=1 Tax=Ferrimonas sediminicola TaxID=2569538 RepID=A0A4U1BBN8_9GAMM|nr:penicillin-binding protein activator [Ferrimonas sediminicola]TKB48033.1 penicillin-binding protein activator [Ferrimonas sediminicola]
MKNFSCKLTKRVLPLLLTALLASCATGPAPSPEAPEAKVEMGRVTQSAAQYLQKASSSEGDTRQQWLLLAARAYIAQGDIASAAQLLASLDGKLDPAPRLQAEFALLMSELAKAEQNRGNALARLDWPSDWTLDRAQWQHYYRLKGELYQLSAAPLPAAAAYYTLGQYQEKAERPESHERLWHNLGQVDEQALLSAVGQSQDPQWRGWLELAWLAKHFAIQPSTLVGELARWQRDNPGHPAARALPADLQRALTVQPYRPQSVAVLLPLTGRVAAQAKAIQDGLLSRALEQDGGRQLRFYDTGAQDAAEAYQAAVTDGAEFIIGPLLKANVDKVLAVADPQLPMLLLNQPAELPEPREHHYFFALSPEEEAMHVAEKLFQDGRLHPLVLAPASSLGRRMAREFDATWQTLTEEPVEVHYFDRTDTMQDSVRSALQVDASLERIRAVKQAFGRGTQADFRSRDDVDAIFLIADAGEIRLLKPFIDVNISVFAQPPQLYTSSRANAKANNGQERRELDRLYISDMPWLLGETPMRSQVAQLWPDRSDSQLRLYAMGHDSWALIDRLAQMRVFSGYRIQGLSGQLAVTENGVLSRQLGWAQYRRGRLRAEP